MNPDWYLAAARTATSKQDPPVEAVGSSLCAQCGQEGDWPGDWCSEKCQET